MAQWSFSRVKITLSFLLLRVCCATDSRTSVSITTSKYVVNSQTLGAATISNLPITVLNIPTIDEVPVPSSTPLKAHVMDEIHAPCTQNASAPTCTLANRSEKPLVSTLPPTTRSNFSLSVLGEPGHTDSVESGTSPASIDAQHGFVKEFPTTAASPACNIFVPFATAYVWYMSGKPTTAVPTNSDGTRVETLKITTGAIERYGKLIHQTTETVIAFPTQFTAGADRYTWNPGNPGSDPLSGYSTSFFSTVFSIPPLPTWADQLRFDLNGYMYALKTTGSDFSHISHFQTMYPDLAVFRTCSPVGFPVLRQLPPGILDIASLQVPTEPGATGPTQSMSSSASNPSQSSIVDANLFSVLTTISSSPSFPGNSMPATEKATADSHTAFATTTPIVHQPLVPFSGSQVNSRRTSLSPPQESRNPNRGSCSVLSGDRTTSTIAPNLSETPKAEIESLPVSVISGDVVVDGHTLEMNSMITLGSGSIITRVGLETNSVGNTILVGDSTTTKEFNSDRPSPSGGPTLATPHAARPTLTHSVIFVSTVPSSHSSRVFLASHELLQVWAALWTFGWWLGWLR